MQLWASTRIIWRSLLCCRKKLNKDSIEAVESKALSQEILYLWTGLPESPATSTRLPRLYGLRRFSRNEFPRGSLWAPLWLLSAAYLNGLRLCLVLAWGTLCILRSTPKFSSVRYASSEPDLRASCLVLIYPHRCQSGRTQDVPSWHFKATTPRPNFLILRLRLSVLLTDQWCGYGITTLPGDCRLLLGGVEKMALDRPKCRPPQLVLLHG